MDGLFEFFEQNPWIIPVGAAVIAVICLLLEIFVFRSRRLDSIYELADDDYEYYSAVRRSDRNIMLVYFFAIGLPSLATILLFLFYSNGTLEEPTAIYILMGYLLVATIVLAIIRRDYLLIFLWLIPTWTLGSRAHKTFDGDTYDVEIDANGHGTVSQHYGIGTVIFAIIGFLLFFLKMIIIAVYLLMIALANTVLSLIGYPILYTACIIKTTKDLKNC